MGIVNPEGSYLVHMLPLFFEYHARTILGYDVWTISLEEGIEFVHSAKGLSYTDTPKSKKPYLVGVLI